MLKHVNRLTKRKEFAYIYKNAKSTFNKNLTLLYLPTKLKEPRIGISISKKVGKAHVRNKIKRQIREIVREMLPNLNQKFNYVFIVRPTMVNLTYLEIYNNVENVLKRANLISINI